MKKQLLSEGRKRSIDTYINQRCSALQEGRQLNEWEWPSLGDVWDTTKNIGKGLGKMAWNLSGPGMMYNVLDRGAGAYNDIKAGEDWKDVAGNVANMYTDDLQSGLDVAGMIPAVGIFADAPNIAISSLRAGLTDDPKQKEKHLKNAALSTAAAVPGFGLAAGAGKIGTNMAKLGANVDKAGRAIKTGLKTSKVPLKVTKNTIKSADKGGKLSTTPQVQTAGAGSGKGPFSWLYNTVKDPVANAFDFSKSTTMNY